MEKAKEFSNYPSKFIASKGWLDKFYKRTKLSKIMKEIHFDKMIEHSSST